MKTRFAFTNDAIAKAKADVKPFRLWDTKVPGLFLRIQPSGAKTYNVLWTRSSSKSIGKHPTLTVEAARTRALAILADAAANGTPAVVRGRDKAAEVVTFGEFIDKRYAPHVLATAKAGKATIDALKKHFGYLFGKRLDAISRADFDTFKAKRLNAGTAPSTVNRDLDRIKAALARAIDWELLAVHPLRAVRRIKRGIENRVRFLSRDEERRLRMSLQAREDLARERRDSGNAWRLERGAEAFPSIVGYSDHLMPMTLLALNTGLRRGELTQVTWADVDLVRKKVTVRAGYAKSGTARYVDLNSEARAVLKQWRKQIAGEGRLFGVADVKKAWAGLMAAAELENFRFHDLRHTFASNLVMAGVDLNTVRELLGHGDIKMTLRYAHLAPEHRAAAVEKLVG